MSIQRFFYSLQKDNRITVQFACELKGNGFGYGKSRRAEVFYIYNSPAWNYYRITDTPVSLGEHIENGVRYVGVDLLDAAKMAYQNSFALYRALKSSQIYINKYSTRNNFLKVYIDGDFPLHLAEQAEVEYPRILNFDMSQNFSVYEYLEAVHVQLMVRILWDLRLLPYSHLDHIYDRYAKSQPSIQFYKSRLSELIRDSKHNPEDHMILKAEDLDFANIISSPLEISRKQPRNNSQTTTINELVSQILTF